MPLDTIPYVRRLFVPYTPCPADRSFEQQAQTQTENGMTVSAAVLDSRESRRYFGVPIARHSIQPVWLRINLTGDSYFTDGKRAVVVLSEENVSPKLIDWE